MEKRQRTCDPRCVVTNTAPRPEPEDIINVDPTRIIQKNVSAILRGKDSKVTAKTFIDPMLEDLKESTQQDEAAQQLISAIKSNFEKETNAHQLNLSKR